MKRLVQVFLILGILFAFGGVLLAQTYVGTETCKTCHTDIYNDFMKSGHPFKIQKVNGAPPQYPAGTSPGVPNPPADMTWDSITYVIGGYGWKARFMDKEGYILTGDSIRQYNLANPDLGLAAGWTGYDASEAPRKPYTCGACHTTGWVATGADGPHQDNLPGIYGTWAEPGVRCEACHGPGSEHVSNPTGVALTKTERCGDCHSRGDVNTIDVKGGLIKHHEQYETLLASPHKSFNCSTCHEPHKGTKYDLGGYKEDVNTCQVCHSTMEIKIPEMADLECHTCHMPRASKSAVYVTINYPGGTVKQGDLRTHIFRLTTDTTWNIFTDDGKWVRKDSLGNAYMTLDFACLTCHTDETMSWAAKNAEAVHGTGTAIEDPNHQVPKAFALEQNYPNPFNPTTTIAFDLPKASHVTLTVYSITGQLVGKFLDQKMPAGRHHVQISGENLASGVYIYTLQADNFRASKKMVLTR